MGIIRLLSYAALTFRCSQYAYPVGARADYQSPGRQAGARLNMTSLPGAGPGQLNTRPRLT
jgi:hypothetical protein